MFYDKLLFVPALNVCVPALDAAATAVASRVGGRIRMGTASPRTVNFAYMAVWTLLFAIIMTSGFLRGPFSGN